MRRLHLFPAFMRREPMAAHGPAGHQLKGGIMRLLSARSLTAKLLLLVLAALMPAFAFALYDAARQYRAAETRIQAHRSETQHLLKVAADRQAALMDEARLLLTGLRPTAGYALNGVVDCGNVFKDTLLEAPGYQNIGLARTNGSIVCQARTEMAGNGIGNQSFYRQALRSGQFSIGPYAINSMKEALVPVGLPVLDPSGQPAGVLFALLDLTRLNRPWAGPVTDGDAVALLFDNHRQILLRQPDTGGGGILPDGTLARAAAHQDTGEDDQADADGTIRHYAFTTLQRTPEQKVSLAVGLRLPAGQAVPATILYRALARFLVSLALVILISRMVINRYILRDFYALLGVAKRIRQGDATARASLVGVDPEFKPLVNVIDDMALSLSRQEQAHTEMEQVFGQLSKMTELLLVSTTVTEAAHIATQFARQIFTDDFMGALYMRQPLTDEFVAQEFWGDIPREDNTFATEDCWALRQGKAYTTYVAGDHQGGPRCRHVSHPFVNYICVPILAQGEIRGLLHLRSLIPFAELQKRYPIGITQLAITIAEQTGLALIDLQRRVSLEEQASRDPLTGLYNRRQMEKVLAQQERHARRNNATFGVLMLDIDFFKTFNDTYGHEAGDKVLQEIGVLLKENIREQDIACRYGGEEFVLIFPAASLETSLARAEEIRKGVEQLKVAFNRQDLGQITVSVGVAGFPEHGEHWEDVLRAADAALYVSKGSGRNRVIMAKTG